MKIRLFTLPNLITLGNLLCGAMAIVAALVYQDLTMAFWLIVAAAVCDFFDGMVARLMGISGPLGVQLDSLADDISFGLAPSAVLYVLFGLTNQGELPEWVGCTVFLFAAFAALRLAKFNIDEEQHTEFRGLPTPAATLYVVALGWSVEQGGLMANLNPWGVLITAWVLAVLMVSNIPMFSLKFKGFGWKGNELRYLFMAFALFLLLVFGVESFLLIIGAYVAFSTTLAEINRSKS
ncbi:MAG: CDP-diacylglycerol--serine O-phosphatidyltransferase [Alistipes sp.]|nr:CDP-diacylglycerol--serine O-phosphatidyltransferase [Alistipes sp.]